MRSKIRIFITSTLLGALGLAAGMFAGPTPEQRDMLQAIDEGSILAWARHITGQDPNDLTSFDKFESVAVIPGSSNRANGDARHDDEVWVLVQRDVNGVSVRYVEQFQPLDWGADPNYCWFVDAGGYGTAGGAGGLTRGSVSAPESSYPTLQELTAGEIPTTPTPPADTALVGAISVTDAAGLQAMTPGNHYSIDADIDLTGVAWTPLVFDSASAIVIEGNNHTISNLTKNSPGTYYVGFIAQIDGTGGGQIRNLNFSNCSVTGRNCIGILCGLMRPDAVDWLISNVSTTDCTVTQSTTRHSAGGAGGLIGELDGKQSWLVDCTVTNCTITTETASTSSVGGLCGSIQETTNTTVSNVIRCDVVGGTIVATCTIVSDTGGLVGYVTESGTKGDTQNVAFYDCSATMDITHTAPVGTVPIVASTGGCFGYFEYGSSTSCTADSTIVIDTTGATNVFPMYGIGGYLGNSSCYEFHTNCSSAGSITFSGTGSPSIDQVGGWGGFLDEGVRILRCYSTTSITITSNLGKCGSLGGFAGEVKSKTMSTSIARSWAEGDIAISGNIVAIYSAIDGIGGFVGEAFTADGVYGLHAENCYSWSSISVTGTHPATPHVTGFIGYITEDIADMVLTNCYCAQTDTRWGSDYTNQIPADMDSHGFGTGAGTTNIAQTAIYYDQETGLGTSALALPKTTDWLQTQSNFEAAGWDFDAIWYIETQGGGSGLDSNDWSGATYATGEVQCVYADGIPRGTFTVDANGVLDLGAEYDVVIAGLNYYSILETTSLHRRGLGRMATIQDVQVNFHETSGAHVGADMTYSADWRFFQKDYLMKSGAARDANGTVGLPYSGEPFAAGDEVYLYGTTNYDGLHTLAADTNNVELRITASYVAETFDGTEWVVHNTPWEPWSGYKGPAPFLRGTNRTPDVYLWEWDPIPMTIRALRANMEVTVE